MALWRSGVCQAHTSAIRPNRDTLIATPPGQRRPAWQVRPAVNVRSTPADRRMGGGGESETRRHAVLDESYEDPETPTGARSTSQSSGSDHSGVPRITTSWS